MAGPKRKVRLNVFKSGIRQRRQNRIGRIKKTALTVTGVFLFLLLNLTLILAHDWVTQTPLLPIESVQVEGAHRLTDEAVGQRSGIAVGGNILAVNLGAARRRLLTHPWIAEAKVSREIPSRIIIRIREHDPRAVLNLGRQFLISSAGVVFKERQEDECADVPVISGIDYADLGLEGASPAVALDAALALLDRQTDRTVPGGHLKIHEIRADPDLGLTLFVATSGPNPDYRTIILGFEHRQQKYRKLAAIQSYLVRRGLMPDAQIFNLRDLDRIVVSPDEHTASAGPTKEV